MRSISSVLVLHDVPEGFAAGAVIGALSTVARRVSGLRPFLGAGAAGAMSMAALGLVLPG